MTGRARPGEAPASGSAVDPTGPGALTAAGSGLRWQSRGTARLKVASRTDAEHRGTGALHWISSALVVVGPDPSGAIVAAAAAVPPEPGVVTVVGDLADPSDWDALTELVPIAVPPGVAARLCVAGVAAPTGPGPAPVATLAESMQADITGPVGRLILVPGGSLFAADGWRRFDGPRELPAGGRRIPAPAWESDVDTLADGAGGELTAVPIPAGLWLYPTRPGALSPGSGELPFSVPVDATRPVLVVGRPGAPAPSPEQVADLVEGLPAATLLVGLGPGIHACVPLATMLARRWKASVELATGLPTLDGAGYPVTLSIDADGGDSWRPLHSRLRVDPVGPPRPVGPPDCLADLAAAGNGAYRLDPRWSVEPIQAGLWVRPQFGGPRAAEVKDRPWDPDRVVVEVGTPDSPLGQEVLPLLHDLLARLPDAVRRRVDVRPATLAGALVVDPRDRPDPALDARTGRHAAPPRRTDATAPIEGASDGRN